MQISFLLHNAYGIGGTIRATFNLATQLAEHHDVEIVSVFRHRDDPRLGIPAGVRIRHLVDQREASAHYDGDDPDSARPATVFPASDSRHKQYSRLTDARIEAHLMAVEADVVVGTRPGLNVHVAGQTRRGPIRVGQEHTTIAMHPEALNEEIRHRYRELDAVTTASEADARAYRELMGPSRPGIEAIPNCVPAPRVAAADGTCKWVVAAGRLAPVKRYDLLIEAFASVVCVRPDWGLRIYGGGGQKQALRTLIDDRGLSDHVLLMGSVTPLETEWVKGSIGVVTSQAEAFGMTIVEAMRCGLPVVSTDCPHGPREIISDGVDGRLVPVGDTGAIARGLLDLIEDDELRSAMGRAALHNSARFDPARIAERHETLFAGLLERRGHGRASARSRGAARPQHL